MKDVKCGKYVGTMIVPEGHLHRRTAPRKKFIQRYRKITETSKSLVERLVDFKVYALSVLDYNGYYFEASSMGSSLWGSLMPLCTPTTITVTTFVDAHIHHRQNKHNPGNFEDCMEDRIRLMTAFTPSYAHAYRVLCLTRHQIDMSHRRFRLPSAKAQYSNLPNNRTTTRKKGDDCKGWAVFTDGGTHVTDG